MLISRQVAQGVNPLNTLGPELDSFAPQITLITELANCAPENAMLSVADPVPSFALIMSSPPNWIWLVTAWRSGDERLTGRGGCDCERRGMTVTPLWSLNTGTETFSAKDRSPRTSDTNVEAHMTSRVVTPKCLLGSNTPCFLSTSATISTVELTGFEMTSTKALGTMVTMPVARLHTMQALILKRSSLVLPSVLGTRVGMTIQMGPKETSALGEVWLMECDA